MATRDEDLRPGERIVRDSLEDSPVQGKPLSRSARRRVRSIEAHMAAAIMPRHIERLRQIADEIAHHLLRLEREHERLSERAGEDFPERWRETARRWRFDHVNDLIRRHNEYYPIEARLPMDPRTGDYLGLRGRSHRRTPLDADWILERFPASSRGRSAA